LINPGYILELVRGNFAGSEVPLSTTKGSSAAGISLPPDASSEHPKEPQRNVLFGGLFH
jgi:hypothetical protein